MDVLERFYPDIKSKVEVTDVATPFTYYRYTKCRHGASMGWLPSSRRMLAKVEKTLPGLKNFYLAGQWSMQTGGVQPSILSGRHAIQMVCNQEKQEFKTI